MDIRNMLLSGRYTEAVARYGKDAVCDEIGEMAYHDLADKALYAAEALGYSGMAKLAAIIIVRSGGYSDEAHQLAGKYCSRK